MYCGVLTVKGESSSFSAAYFQPGNGREDLAVVSLFPLIGPELKVALPGLPVMFRVLGFSPDGKAIYGVSSEPPDPSAGIIKIEFNPTRQSRVPGSVGLGGISALTPSQTSNKLFVTGWVRNGGVNECGAFEIDPDAGTLRALRTASSGGCGGVRGPISPDGKRVVSETGKQLSLLDIGDGRCSDCEGCKRGRTN